jgi:hypothetical protein
MASAHDLTKTHLCKFPGCTAEASSPVGRYAYCSEHRSPTSPKQADGGALSIATALGSLQAAAKRVDRLRTRAEKLTRDALAAKHAADEAERDFRARLAELGSSDARTA